MKISKHAFAVWKANGRPTDPQNVSNIQRNQAKKLLRRAQRWNAASERAQTHTKIMRASEYDQLTFHRLKNNQRNHKSPAGSVSIQFPEKVTNGTSSHADAWANYFADLATHTANPLFDADYKDSVDLNRRLIRANIHASSNIAAPVEAQDTEQHVNHLKNGKACDAGGVSAEHIKYASPIITDIIALLSNRVLMCGSLPESFKCGLITPVHKKDKPRTLPDGYRRITVTSLVGKIVEKELTSRINNILHPSHSKYQYGFTEGASSNNAAFLLSEALADSKTRNKPLFATYMDASKAFDVVDHSSVMNHLYNRGVDGTLWLAIDSMYTDIHSVVKWNGEVSKTFGEGQGIRQGSVSSTALFNNRSTPLLERLSNCSGRLCIGHIPLGGVMCADDLALLSNSSHGMQCLVNEAANDASRERFTFSRTKTKSVVSNQKANNQLASQISLCDSSIEESTSEKHLGIMRTADGKKQCTIDNRIMLARRTAHTLMGAGLHGLNGLSPNVSIKMFNTYVLPRLTFGLESLVLCQREVQQFENFYRHYLNCF
jgi:hypothetical protein